MRTQAMQPLQTQQPQRIELFTLAARIKKWVDHCQAVAQYSNSDVYKSLRRLKHLDMIKGTLYPVLLSPGSWNLKDLCQFTLMVEFDLEGILPIVTNNSYQSSLDNLKLIIFDCRTILKRLTPQ